jgi:hypothetical protein
VGRRILAQELDELGAEGGELAGDAAAAAGAATMPARRSWASCCDTAPGVPSRRAATSLVVFGMSSARRIAGPRGTQDLDEGGARPLALALPRGGNPARRVGDRRLPGIVEHRHQPWAHEHERDREQPGRAA